jgi:hypothetical protein
MATSFTRTPPVFGVLAHHLGPDAVGVELEAVVEIEVGRDDLADNGGDPLLRAADASGQEVSILGHPASGYTTSRAPVLPP